MRFSILWSVSTGPFFIYLLYLFIYLYYNYFLPKTTISNKNNKKFYFFLLIEIFLNKLKQLSKMLLGSFSEKKNCIVLKGKKVYQFFSKTTVSQNVSSNFILSVFSRKIYSKFYVVFTTYKNTKIKKKLLERYSVKKYF